MSLNLSKLEKVRHLGNRGVEARCPACAEGGHDRKGEHLLIKPDGRFGCCANPKDPEHRKRIFALAGDSSPRSIEVKSPTVKVAAPTVISGILGRLGRGKGSPAKTDSEILGRFGRVFASPTKPEATSDASDGVNEVQSERERVRTLRTGSAKSSQNPQRESRTLRTPQYPYTLREKCVEDGVCIKVQGVPVGASEASEIVPPWVESERGVRSVRESEGVIQPPMELVEGVRSVRMPCLTPGGVLGIPFDSPERYHWWKGGQSVATTRAEVLAAKG